MLNFKISFVFLNLVSVSSLFIFGELSSPAHNLILVCLMLLLVAALFEQQKPLDIVKQSSFTFLVITVAAFIVLPKQLYLVRLFLLTIFSFFAFKILQNSKPQTSSLLLAIGVTTFLFTFFLLLYSIEPFIWAGMQIFIQNISSILGTITKQQILLSVTASGIMITILFFLFGICVTISPPPPPKKEPSYYLWNRTSINQLFVYNSFANSCLLC